MGHQLLDNSTIVINAAVRAANFLGITPLELGSILGISNVSVTYMHDGSYVLKGKSFEIALIFVRFCYSLDCMLGGDCDAAHAWMRNLNAALDARPIDVILTVEGLRKTVSYLDSRCSKI